MTTVRAAIDAIIDQLKQLNTKHNNLSNQVNGLKIGGRNLLRDSNRQYNSNAYGMRYELTEAPNVGDDVVITLWCELGSDRTGIGVYNSVGFGEIVRLQQIAPNVWRGVGQWKKPMRSGQEITPNDTHLNVYFYPKSGKSTNIINKIMLERGNVGTNWQAAPEDLEARLAALENRIVALENRQTNQSNGVFGD